MRIAHVRERHAPAGAPWRLAAALDAGEDPRRWLDLEPARRRLGARDPELAHNDPLFRQRLTTLDAHLAAGGRVEHLRAIVEPFLAGAIDPDDESTLESDDLRFGPPILQPPSFRDFYAFEDHVRTMWARRNDTIPEAWYRLPIFYFSNVSEVRGPGDPVWAARGSQELDYELEIGALVDAPATDLEAERAEAVIGGYFVLDDWSARDLQRDESTVRLGPAKGKDFALSIGPWLVTPDELAEARSGKGYALTGMAAVNGQDCSRGTWSDIHFSFGEMLARASADVHLRPGDILGSGTIGSGSLLESREETLGRYLQPGDTVSLAIERLGRLDTPVVERPA
ncbi:MAG TPA: fumarylacetoacetate hydrolase family protein [Candidatus Limnocylindrales bacterium]|nr:fumarylacetoacetate hydrolase family protein [Candidatus Limnocylindrales bacterium]